MKRLIAILVIILVGRIARSYFANNNIESPKVLNSTIISGNIELREIAPRIQATVIVSGKQKQALYKGFSQLAGYIFGGNTTKSSVAMTTPVASSTSESIAMTTPVGSERVGEQYRISFTMPSSYTLETLPKPLNSNIQFEQIPATSYYVRKFSGFANGSRGKKQLELFQKALTEQGIQTNSTPILNQYNDPRTIRFMRTNERRIAK